jgi:hypothetical protein
MLVLRILLDRCAGRASRSQSIRQLLGTRGALEDLLWSRQSVSVMRLCECLARVVRTCDKGSIGARRSCLREACRPGLGSLLWEELVFDGVLRSRPGDGRLDEAVSGLTTGMVSFSSAQLARFVRMRMRQSLHCLVDVAAQHPTWTAWEATRNGFGR